MILEFELDYDSCEEGLVIYKVLRKGLQVGTLTLDEEPYGRVRVRKGNMKVE